MAASSFADSANCESSSATNRGIFFLKRFAVVLDLLGPDVAAGREHVSVRGDLGGGGGFAEAGHIGILTRRHEEGCSPGEGVFVVTRHFFV